MNSAALMGMDVKKPIDEIILADDYDYSSFAKLVALKVSAASVRSHMISFANQFLLDLTEKLTSEDIGKIQSKLTVAFNTKLKEEKGKDSKKSKGSKQPKLNAGGARDLKNAGYDMYEVDGVAGGEEYRPEDQGDFM